MRPLIWITLFLILTSCSDNSDKRIISVNVDIDKLTFGNKVIDKSDFEGKLKKTIDSLVNSGLDKRMINVHITADKQIPKYEMSEIEKAIRRQGVTREYFWIN